MSSVENKILSILKSVLERLDANTALVTHITHDTQFVLFQEGDPLPVDFAQHMPISHSICQHVVGMQFPLRIEDTLHHPLLRGSPAISELGICAYFGIPIGRDLPSMTLCVLAKSERNWSDVDFVHLRDAVNDLKHNYQDILIQKRESAERAA